MVAQTLVVPRIGVALAVTETAAALVLTFVACVRAPNTILPSRYGIDATKAMRFAVGAADADAVFERVRYVLQIRKDSVKNQEIFGFRFKASTCLPSMSSPTSPLSAKMRPLRQS